MKGTCIRCGKPFNSVDDIHTCTPKAVQMADELYRHGTLNNPNGAADELCRLYEENEAKDALLRQALECLERSDTLGWQANLPVIKAIKERLK
jgi:hypothetical protein